MSELRAQDDHVTHVISRADVDVAVVNTKEAIRLAKRRNSPFRSMNHGSRASEAVAVSVVLPESMQPVATDGSTASGQQVHFPGFRLNPGESKT